MKDNHNLKQLNRRINNEMDFLETLEQPPWPTNSNTTLFFSPIIYHNRRRQMPPSYYPNTLFPSASSPLCTHAHKAPSFLTHSIKTPTLPHLSLLIQHLLLHNSRIYITLAQYTHRNDSNKAQQSHLIHIDHSASTLTITKTAQLCLRLTQAPLSERMSHCSLLLVD